jgi:hypothetical protein
LQSVIEAAYSLIKIGQVRSAEYLLKPFTSELAEVRPTIGQGLAMSWPSSGEYISIENNLINVFFY